MNAVLIRILDVVNRILAVLIVVGFVGLTAAAGYRVATERTPPSEIVAFVSYPALALIAGFFMCGLLATLIDIRDQLVSIARSTSYYRAPSPRQSSSGL